MNLLWLSTFIERQMLVVLRATDTRWERSASGIGHALEDGKEIMLKVAGFALTAASIAGVFTFAEAAARDETSSLTERPKQMSAATPEVGPQQQPAATSSAPSCIRKVKVIYAGLGEIHRAPCTAASD